MLVAEITRRVRCMAVIGAWLRETEFREAGGQAPWRTESLLRTMVFVEVTGCSA